MKERPIIFSAPMVRAILLGTKTQTRRIVKPQPDFLGSMSDPMTPFKTFDSGLHAHIPCPYGQPGDRLWVRETFAIVPRTAYRCSEGVQQTLRPDDPYDHDAAIYRAGWERSTGGFRWRPSIHMPRWASRILLEVVSVRIGRLQDISEADAIAEGISPKENGRYHCGFDEEGEIDCKSPVTAYAWLWNRINGASSWDANTWVWVIEFRRAA